MRPRAAVKAGPPLCPCPAYHLQPRGCFLLGPQNLMTTVCALLLVKVAMWTWRKWVGGRFVDVYVVHCVCPTSGEGYVP